MPKLKYIWKKRLNKSDALSSLEKLKCPWNLEQFLEHLLFGSLIIPHHLLPMGSSFIRLFPFTEPSQSRQESVITIR